MNRSLGNRQLAAASTDRCAMNSPLHDELGRHALKKAGPIGTRLLSSRHRRGDAVGR